ncbi:serine/threonine-protein kinase [Polyangium sorediatum]|uniref:Protein kinase n=1 Tax=Polyangium sorediatum TaxID=889274 RepID=A0ABT6P372_9BACT|nr:serine/threonine-protein kinase [Polyangium sorediatum]MDI1435056.1 protein kinase [Polyangium sorediatum]
MKHGDVLAGRFLVERLAGRGGMGKVYRALDQWTGQPVAVKVLPGLSGDAARFMREARLLSSFAHPRIVRHVAHGSISTREPYLVMEWLEGEDLGARLARGPLDLADVGPLIVEVAEALGALHERGIVHRDLKPGNIYLPEGRLVGVKLLDLGIARSDMSSRITDSGILLGTASYMAPEQANGGKHVDARADVFSLGCVLYECLTGERAFDGATFLAILTRILFEEPPSVREKRPELPAPLHDLMARMLSKSPEARPAQGRAVADELRAFDDLVKVATAGTVEATRAPALTGWERRAAAIIFMGPAPAEAAAEAQARDARIAAEAAAHGGRLERLFDGSWVVLLSDAQVATDLAAQAARCALALRRHAEGRRIALALGRSESTGRLALGPAIDRAARRLGDMDAHARSEHIALDESAVGLLDARFEVAAHDGVFFLRGERDLAEPRTLLGKPTPCVGRDRDLDRIEGLFSECVDEAQPTAVLVTAPAGMGKSRLGREIVQRLRMRDEAPSIWMARGELLGAGSALGMLSELVQAASGIRGGDPFSVRREKLRAAVERRVPSRACARVTVFLGEILGVFFPDEGHGQLLAARRDAQLMGELMREAFLDFLRAACEANPVLVLLEDLHWGDGATVGILDAALRELRECRFFVLAFGRPEVRERFPRLWVDRNVQELRLGQLSKKASGELVRHVLGDHVGPETLARIVGLADGNAFYLEELIRRVAEGKGEDLPETVVAMVQSRLAGLDGASRRLLRAASILGETFWAGGISAMLGGVMDTRVGEDCLRNLVEGEVVTKRRESRFAGETEYTFRHALLREGAYAMVTDEDLALGHRIAGEWLERRGESDPLVLAEHFEKGGEGERAAACYLRAALLACWGGDSETAFVHVEQGLAAGASKEVRIKLLGVYCEASAWALRDAEQAVRRADEVLSTALPGSPSWAQAGFMKVAGCAFLGRIDDLVAALPTLLSAEPDPEARSMMITTVTSCSFLLDVVGMLRVGEPALARGFALCADAEATDVAAKATPARYLALRCNYADEDPWRALQYALQALHPSVLGNGRLDETARVHLAVAYTLLGAFSDAESAWGDITLGAFDLGYLSSNRPFVQAWASADRGDLGEARRRAEELVAFGRTSGRALDEGRGRWALAEVLRRAGELERADQEIKAALPMAIPLDQPGMLATLAALRLAQDRPHEALAVAREAMAKYETMRACSMFFRSAFLRVVHAECLQETGNHEAAKAALADAKEWLLAIAAKIGDDRYRKSFLENVPENRRILEFAQGLREGA